MRLLWSAGRQVASSLAVLGVRQPGRPTVRYDRGPRRQVFRPLLPRRGHRGPLGGDHPAGGGASGLRGLSGLPAATRSERCVGFKTEFGQRPIRLGRHPRQRHVMGDCRLSEPGPRYAWDSTVDRSLAKGRHPSCLSIWTTPPGGPPDRRGARRSATSHLEPADRDRPASAGVQARVQPGRCQVTTKLDWLGIGRTRPRASTGRSASHRRSSGSDDRSVARTRPSAARPSP